GEHLVHLRPLAIPLLGEALGVERVLVREAAQHPHEREAGLAIIAEGAEVRAKRNRGMLCHGRESYYGSRAKSVHGGHCFNDWAESSAILPRAAPIALRSSLSDSGSQWRRSNRSTTPMKSRTGTCSTAPPVLSRAR